MILTWIQDKSIDSMEPDKPEVWKHNQNYIIHWLKQKYV